MAQCDYTGPTGSRCEEPALEQKPSCFWHDRDAEKGGQDIKARLEERAKNHQSMEGFQLDHADLEDAYLINADLSHANLTRANLKDGHLYGINLKGARLFKTDLENANLKESILEGVDLLGANLDGTALQRASWGEDTTLRNHLEAEALKADGDRRGAEAKYLEAEEIYRLIRQRYEASGAIDLAREFFYNEMVVKRKQMPILSIDRFWSKMVDLLCGYGEDPFRVISVMIIYVAVNALTFCILGMGSGGETLAFHLNETLGQDLWLFGKAFYFSIVTFTTLGYGDISPIGWSRPIAAIEALAGVFMNALFLLTFVRKLTR